jgi:hypothetical protein
MQKATQATGDARAAELLQEIEAQKAEMARLEGERAGVSAQITEATAKAAQLEVEKQEMERELAQLQGGCALRGRARRGGWEGCGGGAGGAVPPSTALLWAVSAVAMRLAHSCTHAPLNGHPCTPQRPSMHPMLPLNSRPCTPSRSPQDLLDQWHRQLPQGAVQRPAERRRQPPGALWRPRDGAAVLPRGRQRAALRAGVCVGRGGGGRAGAPAYPPAPLLPWLSAFRAAALPRRLPWAAATAPAAAQGGPPARP